MFDGLKDSLQLFIELESIYFIELGNECVFLSKPLISSVFFIQLS